MNPTMLLTQMLPLLVFIIVDSIVKDVRISIVAAIGFAVVQSLIYYFTTGKFDWMVLIDVGLIAVLGTISIILKNDMFFKVKPAIIEGITIVFFLVLAFTPDRLLLGYFGRMMPGMTLRPEAIGLMKTMLFWMCGYVLLHIGAVLYTAFYSSRKVWAMVSGPGFYLLFVPMMVVILVKARARRMEGARGRR